MRTQPGQCVLVDDIASVIFGVDGVIVDSARAAAAAWKPVLDTFLRTYAAVHETEFVPFEVSEDYPRYMHGASRLDGARAFLASRHIRLPYDDVRGLAARQEEYFLGELRRHGVAPFTSAVTVLRAAHRRGLRTAAVSPQRYGAEMLRRAGVADMFDVRLDGPDVAGGPPGYLGRGLLVRAASCLGTPPERAAVVDETLAAVSAACDCGFQLVIGIDRTGDSRPLEEGADVVIRDLSELRLPRRRAA